jgi:hypothetical protein
MRTNQNASNPSQSWSITLRSICLAFGGLLLSGLALAAHADPVTFTETLTGSSLDGPSPYTTETITITGTGNTDNVVFNSAEDEYTLLLTSATVQQGSNSVETFTGTVEAFVVPGQIAGFEQLTPQNVNIAAVFGFNDPFVGYALDSDISVTDDTQVPASSTQFDTTGGSFDFWTESGTATFTSTVSPVPEPSSVALLVTGLLGVAEIVRRKSRASKAL